MKNGSDEAPTTNPIVVFDGSNDDAPAAEEVPPAALDSGAELLEPVSDDCSELDGSDEELLLLDAGVDEPQAARTREEARASEATIMPRRATVLRRVD